MTFINDNVLNTTYLYNIFKHQTNILLMRNPNQIRDEYTNKHYTPAEAVSEARKCSKYFREGQVGTFQKKHHQGKLNFHSDHEFEDRKECSHHANVVLRCLKVLCPKVNWVVSANWKGGKVFFFTLLFVIITCAANAQQRSRTGRVETPASDYRCQIYKDIFQVGDTLRVYWLDYTGAVDSINIVAKEHGTFATMFRAQDSRGRWYTINKAFDTDSKKWYWDIYRRRNYYKVIGVRSPWNQ